MRDSTIHVLLVEDDPDDYLIVQELIQHNLAPLGSSDLFRLEWAASFGAGLAALEYSKFDVVLVDYGLPPHTGLDFLEAAAKLGCEAPIILLTGRSDHALDVKAMQAGAAGFLVKGYFTAAILERTMRYAIERKRAAVVEQESQRFLQLVLDTLGSSIAVVEEDGTIITTNKEWQRFEKHHEGTILGYGIGVNYIEICEKMRGANAPAAHEVAQGIRQVLHGKQTEFDLDYQCRSGHHERWFHLHVTRFLSDGVIRVVTAHEEITERKHAESALRTSEQRFQSIVANAPGVVYQFVLHPDGRREVPFISEGCRDLYDFTPAQLQRNPELIFEAIYEPDRDEHDRTGDESVRTLQPWRWEGRIRSSGGKIKWVQGTARPQRLPDGSTLWDGLLVDITAPKELEIELERFFTLSLDLFAITDSSGYFKRLNNAFENTLGYSREELKSKPLMEFVHPDDREATRIAFSHLEKGEHISNFVNRNRCKNGSYRWLMWVAAPSDDVIYAVAHDITKLKQTEAALLQSNDDLELRVAERTVELESANHEMELAKQEAEAANQAKSEFLSRMSHELRTPLNAILGFGQILEHEDLNELQQESIRYILKGGRHLLDLINGILDIARVEAGRMELSLESISLDDMIAECCTLMRPIAAQSGIRIIEETVEPCDFHVLADRQRLKQVFINLLSNGIKYNKPNGSVEIACRRGASGRVRIDISDTGVGIPASDMAKLFTPFERLAAAHSQIEGTGLGLILSRNLVLAMNGTLEVRSAVGEGSTFSIDLPETDDPIESLSALASDPVLDMDDDTAQKFTILCIEDNLSNLRLIERILIGRPSITLMSAMQGGLGLDLARQYTPDLILLDLNLPDISGKDVWARLQQSALTRDIPVVIVSADATTSQVEALMRAGVSHYLTKPLDVRQFMQTLDELLFQENAVLQTLSH